MREKEYWGRMNKYVCCRVTVGVTLVLRDVSSGLQVLNVMDWTYGCSTQNVLSRKWNGLDHKCVGLQ